MPWMPEVFTAPIAEALNRREAAGANDAVSYYEGILAGEPDALARSFAARQPVLEDPRLGYVEGREGYAPSSRGRQTGCASATPWWRTWP